MNPSATHTHPETDTHNGHSHFNMKWMRSKWDTHTKSFVFIRFFLSLLTKSTLQLYLYLRSHYITFQMSRYIKPPTNFGRHKKWSNDNINVDLHIFEMCAPRRDILDVFNCQPLCCVCVEIHCVCLTITIKWPLHRFMCGREKIRRMSLQTIWIEFMWRWQEMVRDEGVLSFESTAIKSNKCILVGMKMLIVCRCFKLYAPFA